ncbi:hypothetical protein SASPL_150262 [Salvia splendens]|uniref:Uncharacterized protein n=1 Tax=Salvia splendens TaxID=180675 RepID=A0A8X8Z1V3_SALSN|nr:hypothetical protein SASPL_150262 [Salvia splendens]
MANRFAKLRELGSKGKKYNPLHLDEFQWENEWVDAGCEPVHQDAASDTGNDLTWQNVDEATGATQGLGGRNLPRAAAMKGRVDLNMLLLLQVKGLSNLGQLQFQLKMKCQVKRMMKWEMRVDLITKMMKRVVEVQLQGLSKWMMMFEGVLTTLKHGTLYVLKGSILTGSAETTRSDIHQEARQRSIAIDKTRRAGVKPPLKYGFEDMMAYALQVAGEV